MTGCDRILARLTEGPATAAELYATTYSVVHSRISELRRRGYRIDCERIPEETGARSYRYRLVSEPTDLLPTAHGEHGNRRLADKPSDGEPNGQPEATPFGLPPQPVDTRHGAWPVSSPSEQLTLEVAA